MDSFYNPLPSLVISAGLLAVVGLLTWRGTGRKLALAICIFLMARYMLWRGLYTINSDDRLSLGISLVLILAEVYGFVQSLFFAHQAWGPTDRQSPPIESYPSVDIMVTVVDEPLYILKRTLIGCLAQDYPKDLLEVYVLDDGHRPEVKSMAADLGVSYLAREGRVHAKAGNLNQGMQHSSGELLALFDTDHVPAPTFLQKTVGFFADDEVAIVQTAQDFYNPDIFQRSVGRGRNLYNEQELFFRTLQAGRDRHNSAFFAGSSGLIRRSALEEIGGFQTGTITEDLHTSIKLHAKGYKSCYLNETLASGLMPETFEGHTKQRARWATGTAQVLMRENPLFMRGLTLRQRVDYFGSIHYFFFGLPRIIFLIAPLSWLIFSIPGLRADTASLLNFFFSAYMASVLATQLISRNTRNAFWSDLHEVVMCFAVTRAIVVGLFSANKDRKFEVTPKSARSEGGRFESASVVGWHLGLFGLLIFGITNGVVQALGPNPSSGLPISLLWASYNVLLVSVAILSAREPRQLRDFTRHIRRFPCLILDGEEQCDALILDVTESGAAIRIPVPRFALPSGIRISVRDAQDKVLTLNARVVHQELEESGEATLGVQFDDVDESAAQGLIALSFASVDTPFGDAPPGSGTAGSFWSLLSAPMRIRKKPRASHRRTPRLPMVRECLLQLGGVFVAGTTRDASFAGLSAIFPGNQEIGSQVCSMEIEDVELTVRPIDSFKLRGETVVHFQVETIEEGEPTWQAWHQPSSH